MLKSLFVSLSIICLSVSAFADDWEYTHFPGGLGFGPNDVGGSTTHVLGAAMVYGTSGTSWGVAHNARESQTTSAMTAYFYCTSTSGTPNEAVMHVYASAGASEDPDRPDTGGSPLFTSSNIDISGTTCSAAPVWVQVDFSSVTLTQGTNYYFILTNTEADGATNNFTAQVRAQLEQSNTSFAIPGSETHETRTNTDGWTGDGTDAAGVAPLILKYNSGLLIGNPYVATGAAHASNQNYRGNRFTPTEDMRITGFFGNTDTNFGSLTIATASGGTQSTGMPITTDERGKNRVGGASFNVLLTGGTTYDILQKASANDTFGTTYTMGNSPPADVVACGLPLTYVDGATLGSLTETTSTVYACFIEVADNPAISGGSSTDLLGVIQ